MEAMVVLEEIHQGLGMPVMVDLVVMAATVLLARTVPSREKMEETAALPGMAERAARVVLQVALEPMEMAVQAVLVATVARVAMVPLASMVRCLVNQERLAVWAAMAVRAD